MNIDQNYYLKLMGIEVWQERFKTIPQESYTLLSGEQPIGLVSLEKLAYPADQEEVVLSLLDAMLTAIKLQRGPLTASTEGSELILGEQLAQHRLGSDQSLDELRQHNPHQRQQQQIIVSYHPWDLLQNPANKRKAWEDLKRFTVT